jgi:hypothetical protein
MGIRKVKPRRQPAVILAIKSGNKKLAGCAVTYVAQQSCPQDCRFLGPGNGCYAQYGPMKWGVTDKVNEGGRGLWPAKLADMERRKILGGLGDPAAIGRPLRLHGVGDCKTNLAAKIVAEGAEVWRRTAGAPVWGYTHAWKRVKRASWGRVSILASVEGLGDLVRAHQRGYAAALVVNWFPYGPKAYTQWVKQPGKASEKFKVVPCPEQSMPGRGIGCKDCQLCMKDGWLRASRTVIGFAAHGPGAGKVREKLVRIGEDRPGEGVRCRRR